MILGVLTLLVALSISGIAAFYSIVGLATIYAGAFWPIIIMGSALEVGKIITTIWLHTHWDQCPRKLKAYLTSAVIALMFLTSMGVFGFLSKSHVEQTAQSEQNLAKVESIEADLNRQELIIDRAEEKIEKFETQGSGRDTSIQAQIDREQERIDRAYERIQPQIETLEQTIQELRDREQNEIQRRQDRLNEIDQLLADGEVAQVQRIIGAVPDGVFGPNTRDAIEQYRERIRSEINEIRDNPNPDIVAAREEIQRLRDQAARQVQESSDLIDRLRTQLGNDSGEEIEQLITEQQQIIEQAEDKVDALTEEKFALETEFRKLEAEVGPVKYIAELVYGESDRSMLEDAVRWVTILIVSVFDPLAICLVLAGTMTIGWARKEQKTKKTEKVNDEIKELKMKIQEYEQLIAEIEKALDESQGKVDNEQYNQLQSEHKKLQEEKAELEQYVEELGNKVVELEREVKRRDDAVTAMAKKYKLVEKDSFPEEVENEAKNEPKNA